MGLPVHDMALVDGVLSPGVRPLSWLWLKTSFSQDSPGGCVGCVPRGLSGQDTLWGVLCTVVEGAVLAVGVDFSLATVLCWV